MRSWTNERMVIPPVHAFREQCPSTGHGVVPVPEPEFADKDRIHEGRELLIRIVSMLAQLSDTERKTSSGTGTRDP